MIEGIIAKVMTTDELKEEVMQLLTWSDEEFQGFVFETGLAYLQQYFGADQNAIDQVKVKKEFWNWFRNHWSYRDQVFFSDFFFDTDCDQPFRLKMYKALHSPEMLACEIYPSSGILGNKFSTIKNHVPC